MKQIDPEKRKHFLALVALWCALFLWGTHGPIGRYLALKGVPILGVMAARLWIGSLVYWTLLLLSGKVQLSFLRGNFRKILILSVTGIYLNLLTFHAGMNYIPATLILLLENLAPFFVILFLWVFEKKRPSSIQMICQICATAGLLLIIFGKVNSSANGSGETNEFFLGVLLELCAGLTWAIYSYFSSKWLSSMNDSGSLKDKFFSALNFTCILFSISAVLATPQLVNLGHASLTSQDMALILFLGVFPTAGAFMLWNYALSSLSVSMVSTSFYMTIVFTCINEMIFLGLHLSWTLIIGSVLIMGSALKLTISRRK